MRLYIDVNIAIFGFVVTELLMSIFFHCNGHESNYLTAIQVSG